MRSIVIIESPYSGDIERNTLYAREAVRDAIKRGEAPYASHLLYTQEGILRDEVPEERAEGIDAGLSFHYACSYVVVYVDYGITEGMKQGITHAAEMGVDIIARSIKGAYKNPVIDIYSWEIKEQLLTDGE